MCLDDLVDKATSNIENLSLVYRCMTILNWDNLSAVVSKVNNDARVHEVCKQHWHLRGHETKLVNIEVVKGHLTPNFSLLQTLLELVRIAIGHGNAGIGHAQGRVELTKTAFTQVSIT